MDGTLNIFFKCDEKKLSDLTRLRQLLSGPEHFLPFIFNFPNGELYYAPNAGLEGFLYTLLQLEMTRGVSALMPLTPYFLRYLSDLFVSTEQDPSYLQQLSRIPSRDRLYHQLKAFLETKTESLRCEIQQLDGAAWIRSARIYQIYPRAFYLTGLREVSGGLPPTPGAPLFQTIEATDLPGSFDAIRWTGTYPIGEVDRKGIGSPFAIIDHSKVHESLGNTATIREKIIKLEQQGIRSIFELSPNHTAVDATLVEESPECYIHTTAEPEDLTGYYRFRHGRSKKVYWIRRGGYSYDGARYYWDDTLQLDISNPKTVEALTRQLKDLIRTYGVHGFRVDMAYQLLHTPFAWNWRDEIQFPLGRELEDEFFYKLIHAIKLEFPHVGFIAEGFYHWERLSAAGFDVIYSKNEMPLAGGYQHIGWYNALQSRNPYTIREAINRASFLQWQKGGAGMICFVGHHDSPAPQRAFGDWVKGATFLTMFLPVARNWYAGTEANFEAVCPENGKMITFARDVKIDWSGLHSDFGHFFRNTLRNVSLVRSLLGEAQAVTALPCGPLVGYRLTPEDGAKNAEAIIIANPTDDHHQLEIEPGFCCPLGPLGFAAFLNKGGGLRHLE